MVGIRQQVDTNPVTLRQPLLAVELAVPVRADLARLARLVAITAVRFVRARIHTCVATDQMPVRAVELADTLYAILVGTTGGVAPSAVFGVRRRVDAVLAAPDLRSFAAFRAIRAAVDRAGTARALRRPITVASTNARNGTRGKRQHQPAQPVQLPSALDMHTVLRSSLNLSKPSGPRFPASNIRSNMELLGRGDVARRGDAEAARCFGAAMSNQRTPAIPRARFAAGRSGAPAAVPRKNVPLDPSVQRSVGSGLESRQRKPSRSPRIHGPDARQPALGHVDSHESEAIPRAIIAGFTFRAFRRFDADLLRPLFTSPPFSCHHGIWRQSSEEVRR